MELFLELKTSLGEIFLRCYAVPDAKAFVASWYGIPNRTEFVEGIRESGKAFRTSGAEYWIADMTHMHGAFDNEDPEIMRVFSEGVAGTPFKQVLTVLSHDVFTNMAMQMSMEADAEKDDQLFDASLYGSLEDALNSLRKRLS